MFEVLEHTADVGLRIRAAGLNDLFAEAGRGLFSLMVENPDEARPQVVRAMKLQADRLDDLFFDWLNELLYLFDHDHLVLCRFDVNVQGNELTAEVAGEPLDRERHRPGFEVKAITYHALSVRQEAGGWVAEVIVDI